MRDFSFKFLQIKEVNGKITILIKNNSKQWELCIKVMEISF